MIACICDLIWPTLPKETSEERTNALDANRKDIAEIAATDWSKDPNVALDEARRIMSSEDERKKTAEGKAFNVLLLIGALIPILTYFESTIWQDSLELGLAWLSVVISIAAIAYLGGAAVWAFRAISVGSYHRVYTSDLTEIWQMDGTVQSRLTAELLKAARGNQKMINTKITSVIMTHKFLFRAIIIFGTLFISQIIWKAATCLI